MVTTLIDGRSSPVVGAGVKCVQENERLDVKLIIAMKD